MFGLDFFCKCTGNIIAMSVSQLNKCICLSENIYMDSFILAEVLFNHNFIHLFLIVPRIMFHKAKEKKSDILQTLRIGLHLYHTQNDTPQRTSAPQSHW